MARPKGEAKAVLKKSLPVDVVALVREQPDGWLEQVLRNALTGRPLDTPLAGENKHLPDDYRRRLTREVKPGREGDAQLREWLSEQAKAPVSQFKSRLKGEWKAP